MSPEHELESVTFERAKRDPAAVFRKPEEVLEHPAFTCEQKCEILRAWVQDATRLSESEAEGMGGGEPAMLGRVLDALHCAESGAGKPEGSERAFPKTGGSDRTSS